MPHETLFGHLAVRLGDHPENVAVEALGFILDRSATARGAVTRLVRSMGVGIREVSRFRTQVTGEQGARPEGRRVDFALFLEFVQSMNAVAGDANFRQVFDLDGDGAIAFADFLAFARNFNRVVYWSGL